MSYRNPISLLLIVCASVAFAEPLTEVKAIQVVAQLYRDFAWEAVIDSPRWHGHDLLNQPRRVLERYFDPNLAALIRRDRQCVAKTHEVCNLNFSPIWASQDPGATELKVVAGVTPETVIVRFRYPGNGEKVELVYRMARTKAGWRVADIRYSPDSTLLSMLSAMPQQ